MQATLDQVESTPANRAVRKLKQSDLTSVTATGLLRGCCYQGCCEKQDELAPNN